MDLGSDADLVFVATDAQAAARLRPVAEKLLQVISGYTRDGTLFPIDVRLRPRGGEGELVQTGERVLDYFSHSAEVWEAVTYLKARPVAGNLEWAEEWCDQLREVLRRRFSQWATIQPALVEMRRRLEEEITKSREGGDNLKTGVGGFYDLDFIFSALSLASGATSMAAWTLTGQGERAEGSSRLSGDERFQLHAAACVLRAADHAIRLVTGRGTAQLPRGPRAELVAELAGGFLGEDLTTEMLVKQVQAARESVRAIYLRVFA
jgi:glutamate-ammonia-ligase adenylyltransferase